MPPLRPSLGRLQTDADRARVMAGLGKDKKKSELGALVKKLAPRWFVVRDARSAKPTLLAHAGRCRTCAGR